MWPLVFMPLTSTAVVTSAQSQLRTSLQGLNGRFSARFLVNLVEPVRHPNTVKFVAFLTLHF